MWKSTAQIAIIVTVGAIVIDSSHGGRSCSSSRQRQQLFRWRRVCSPMPMQKTASEDEVDRDWRINDCLLVHTSSKKVSSSLILSYSVRDTVVACARGGGGGGGSIEDDARRRQPGHSGHDDRLPDRRSSSSLTYDDSYDNTYGRNRNHRSGPRPSREDGARVPSPRTDHSVDGSEEPRRDRRDYRNDSMGGIDDDRSLWNGRERSRGFDRRDHIDERDRRELGNPRSRRPNYNGDGHGESNTTTTHIAKRKAWFTSKNDRRKVPQYDGSKTKQRRDLDDWDNNIYPFPPPPPPPPPPSDETTKVSLHVDINPAQTDRVPIHYMFPTAGSAAEERQLSDTQMNDNEINMEKSKMDDALDVPYLEVEEEFLNRDRGRRRRIRDDDEDGIEFEHRRVSPRRDAVTTFMSTRRGAMKVRVGSIIVGAAIGGFIGKVRIKPS
jgi:hypothetical protein